MEKKTLGSFIAVLRKAKGFTQQQLADMLNVSNKAVSKWECEETLPDISLLPVIAEVLEVTCDELLRGERILSEEKQEKTEKRGEKQLKNLVNKCLFKYKNTSVASFIAVFIGLVLMFLVTYSGHHPIIGFSLAVCMFLIAVVIQIFDLSWLNHTTENGDIFGDKSEKRDYEIYMQRIKNTKCNYSFAVFYSVFFSLWLILPLLVLPLILFRTDMAYRGILSLESYMELLPVIMLMPLSIFFVARQLYTSFMLKTTLKKSLFIYDLVLTCALEIFYLSVIITLFASKFSSQVFPDFWYFAFLILGIIITFVGLAIKTKSKDSVLRVTAVALRNIAYVIAIMVFFASKYQVIGEDNATYFGYIIGGEKSLISGLIMIITTAIYFALTKNKNIYGCDKGLISAKEFGRDSE